MNAAEPARILVVEDEALIADRIERYLARGGYEVVGAAADFDEAAEIFRARRPDLVLLDIRLAGARSGVALGHWLRAEAPGTPFVYVTSQFDARWLELACATYPDGYLTKPIREATLLATVGVSLARAGSPDATAAETIVLREGSERWVVPLREIAYVRADHVYVEYHLVRGRILHVRSTLREAAAALPPADFAAVHRSYVVNVAHVGGWGGKWVEVGGARLPVSRSRREGLAARLGRRGYPGR